jgi:hypothetical protein
MNIEVTKYEFYEGEGQHLKYIDTTKKVKCEHSGCNCTKIVSEKPTTRLKSRQIAIDAFLKRDKYDIEINLRNGNHIFRWGDKHAYFNMLYEGDYRPHKDKGIRIEIFKEGWSSVDYFFATMFLGQHVNISTLMNGHSPSRIIDLNDFGRDDIWLHGCCWGKESVKILGDYKESDMWRRVIETSANVTDWTSLFKPEADYTIQEIKEQVLKQNNVEESINFCVDFFVNVIDNLESTDLYKLSTMIKNETKKK